jgi:iron complex transport system permease protein
VALSAGLAAGVVVLVAVLATSLVVGARPTALAAAFDAIRAYDPGLDDHVIVRQLRLPRTLIGLLAGIGLGLAGAVMQGITRNPLADPGLLGVNAGAALAVVIAIHLFGVASLTGYVWFAFAGAALASVAVYLLGATGRDGATPIKLALAGAALTALLGSITTGVLLVDATTLDQFRFWAVGSLSGRDGTMAAQAAPFVVIGAVVALGTARSLDVLALGDDVARSLGQHIGLVRLTAAASVVVLAGTATAAAGPIVFVGLTVPHIARSITGPDHRWLLAYSAVLAPILLVGADVLGRVVARPGEVQVGIITAMLGAPVFVALVRRRTLRAL